MDSFFWVAFIRQLIEISLEVGDIFVVDFREEQVFAFLVFFEFVKEIAVFFPVSYAAAVEYALRWVL